MQRPSQQDADGTVFQTVGLPVGGAGLDLRRADEPGVLTECLNARFLDGKTVVRRDGHHGRTVHTGYAFQEYTTPLDEWIYGHGRKALPWNDELNESYHYPAQYRGGGTFRFGDSDVVWTGDRLLVATAEGPFQGLDSHWYRPAADGWLPQGLEAYLPIQTDEVFPLSVDGTRVEGTLTSRYRVVAAIVAEDSDTSLMAWVYDRETGVLISEQRVASDVAGAEFETAEPMELRVINSGEVPVLLFRCDDEELYMSYYLGGLYWSEPTVVQSNVDAFDTDVAAAGFYVMYRKDDELFVGRFVQEADIGSPFTFGTAVPITGTTPNGAVAMAVSPMGDLGFVWQGEAADTNYEVYLAICDGSMVQFGAVQTLTNLDKTTAWTLTCAFRGLRDEYNHCSLVVYGSQAWNPVLKSPADVELTKTWEYRIGGSPLVVSELTERTRYNCLLASRAARFGDEVFAFLYSENSATNFLVAGVDFRVVGISDREEAVHMGANPTPWVPSLVADPLDPDVRAWVRRRNVGEYVVTGNTRWGFIDFLPPLSTAHYGKSVYLAGSHVRCYDGHELGDAGFHDYPLASGANATTGSMPNGDYQVRVYPVRYNKQGERFQGAALNAEWSLAGTDDAITWTITTMPITNHDDVELEVWRTDSTGVAPFYYEGKVRNDPTVETVTFTSTLADETLALNPQDSFDTGVGLAEELEEFGPIGCAALIAAGDRLWGFGGQVPAGVVQFSKLFSQNEGVGFDALAGTQAMNTNGIPITSIAAFNDSTVVAFERDRFYVLTGGGPDNYGNGTFSIPQILIADGALSHQGTIVLPIGIAYWGADGPRLLTSGFEVENISAPVASLATTLTPSGVRAEYARREVIWYTESGHALLWNYAESNFTRHRFENSKGSRWARWTGLRVAGASQHALLTTNCRLLTPDPDLRQDDGRRFHFVLRTGNVRLEDLHAGGVTLRRYGMVGEYRGEHRVRFRLYYDGSPMWSESTLWEPDTGTGLVSGEVLEDLLPDEVDALIVRNRGGRYATSRRAERQTCSFFQLEVSDLGDDGFTPWEFNFEVGAKPGLGRVAVNTFENRS
jgi:hypothetical protein